MADMSNGGISDRTNSIVPNVHDDGAPNGSDSADVINSKDNYLTSHHVERIARYWGVDSIDDVNAATAMLALKHGPKVFSENFQTGYVCPKLDILIKSWCHRQRSHTI